MSTVALKILATTIQREGSVRTTKQTRSSTGSTTHTTSPSPPPQPLMPISSHSAHSAPFDQHIPPSPMPRFTPSCPVSHPDPSRPSCPTTPHPARLLTGEVGRAPAARPAGHHDARAAVLTEARDAALRRRAQPPKEPVETLAVEPREILHEQKHLPVLRRARGVRGCSETAPHDH